MKIHNRKYYHFAIIQLLDLKFKLTSDDSHFLYSYDRKFKKKLKINTCIDFLPLTIRVTKEMKDDYNVHFPLQAIADNSDRCFENSVLVNAWSMKRGQEFKKLREEAITRLVSD